MALEAYQKYINAYLEEMNFSSNNEHLLYLNEAMNYSLLSNGKRIRPAMNIVFYETFGGNREAIMEFSAAIELIHTYSLIHDDLPAMDDDILRRNKATCHIKYSEATAILAGDALLNQAYETMFSYLEKNFNLKTLKACQYLAKASGKHGMIIGQVADMELKRENLTINDLTFTNKNKTGALIKASIVTPAMITNQSQELIKGLEQYADFIGMAFQLKDDLLEYAGDEVTLGKSIDSDQRNNKKTYIRFMGYEKTEKELEKLYKKSMAILKTIGIEHDLIYEMTEFIFNRKH